MSRPIVSLIGVEETRTYALANVPQLENVGAMQLRVQPIALTLSIRDGQLVMVSATGPTVRHDKRAGMHRTATWTEREGWGLMPRWIVRIVRSTGVKWTEPPA